VQTNDWLFYTTGALTLFFMLFLPCFAGWLKKEPINYIIIFVFTILHGYTVAVAVSFAEP
jgi:hypothetical protein